jgi:putative multiple sugar transport system ATP-binding protein
MQPILEMRGITKTFPGVKALTDVNLMVMPGEIHADLRRERRRQVHPDEGALRGLPPRHLRRRDHLRGPGAQFATINDSEQAGIVIIHQELALIPELSIAENIFLGNEVVKPRLIDWDAATTRGGRTAEARVGLDESTPTPRSTNLGVGKQQLVEIAKALSKNVKLLILDEPTSSLNED